MKRIISVLLVFAVIICSFSGCVEKKTTIKLGLAAPTVTHGWVAGVAYYAEKYCNENDIDYMITTSDNAEDMEKNLSKLVNWGAQAIVVWPQWSGNEDAVKKIIEKNIPVVSFDVDINCDGIHKVMGNNYDMGYQCAKYITEKVGMDSRIAVLDVPSAGSVSELRKKGFYDYLNEYGFDEENLIETAEDGFTRECGYNDMKNLLSKYDRIDAVFSMDDEVSIGVAKAILESGRKDIKAVTGGGGMQEYFNMIVESKYEGLGLSSALYSPSMIEDAIQTAIDLYNGKSSSKIVIIPTTIVTSDNVKDYFDKQNSVY